MSLLVVPVSPPTAKLTAGKGILFTPHNRVNAAALSL
jgi:hypothetical protein